MTVDCMNWHIASAGVESYLRQQNHVIEKFYVNLKVFGSKFYSGFRVKEVGKPLFSNMVKLKWLISLPLNY